MKVLLDAPRCALFHGEAGQLVLPENSVDSIVVDPPSGISFMGASWDSDKGGRDRWIAWLAAQLAPARRALKPGGHAVVWALPRTSHWTALAIEDLGFEIRDCIYHAFGTGFPKSLNLQGNWQGWGTALKPACEVWWLARKPLDGTVAANVLAHGTGALNIDGCRIGNDVRFNPPSGGATDDGAVYGLGMRGKGDGTTAVGRWPANLILSHHDECREVGTVEDELQVAAGEWREQEGASHHTVGLRKTAALTTTTTRIVYECHPDCPARMLDEQSGVVGCGNSAPAPAPERTRTTATKALAMKPGARRAGKEPGASRFFYCAKPARAEKEEGLDHLPIRSGGHATEREDGSAGLNSPRAGAGRNGGVRNVHPTAKSVALMTWLIRLITPPGGLVVDPFAGSGTTGVAALGAGFSFVGVELGNPTPDDLQHHHEYLPIVLGRLRRALALPQYHPAQDPALVGVDGWWCHEPAPVTPEIVNRSATPTFDLGALRDMLGTR